MMIPLFCLWNGMSKYGSMYSCFLTVTFNQERWVLKQQRMSDRFLGFIIKSKAAGFSQMCRKKKKKKKKEIIEE